MYKTFTFTAICMALLLQACQSGQGDQAEPNKNDLPTKNPGWMEQWHEMKKNDQGIVPFGLQLLWDKQDQRLLMKQESNNLYNVREIGPRNIGGRTRALWVDPADDNRILAGGVSGRFVGEQR
jgi:hypothetical protein